MLRDRRSHRAPRCHARGRRRAVALTLRGDEKSQCPVPAAVLSDAFLALHVAAAALAFSVLLFGFLALALKGRAAIDAAFRAVAEVRLNLAFYFFDALFLTPILTVIIAGLRFVITHYSLTIASEQLWLTAGRPVTFVAVLFLGDFISVLAPSGGTHALVLACSRHPSQRHGHDVADAVALPSHQSPEHGGHRHVLSWHCSDFRRGRWWPTVWFAIITANSSMRTCRGCMAASQVCSSRRSCTAGITRAMSPAQAAISRRSSQSSTVASALYYVPGLCNVPLGVTDDQYPGRGVVRHLLHPFVSWGSDLVALTRNYVMQVRR